MEWLDAGPLRRAATAGLKCNDSRLEAGIGEESFFMLVSVYDRCSKGKLMVVELFWAAPPRYTSTGCARTGRNNVPES